jgi:hypothetical protein
VALAELIAADQLVLELAAVAARERVPAVAAVERPAIERMSPPGRLSLEPPGEQLVALHIDHDDAEPGLDVARDAQPQRVRLARPRRADEQPVSSGLAAEAKHHRSTTGSRPSR